VADAGDRARYTQLLLAIATAFAELCSGRSDGYFILGQWPMEEYSYSGVQIQSVQVVLVMVPVLIKKSRGLSGT